MFTVAVSSIGTPNSAAMVGSATLTTVASMMLMNIAATKTVATAVFGLDPGHRSPPRRRSRPGSAAGHGDLSRRHAEPMRSGGGLET